jgi:hypothetical protein
MLILKPMALLALVPKHYVQHAVLPYDHKAAYMSHAIHIPDKRILSKRLPDSMSATVLHAQR